MKFYLIVAKGKKAGLPIPIEVSLFQIGSAKNCQLRANHEKIGATHCAIVTRDKKVFIRDYDSGEPTLINDEMLPSGEEWPLHAGDTIEVGPLKFVIQFHEKALSQRDLEEWALKCLDQDEGRKLTALDALDQIENNMMSDSASGAAGAILERMNAQKGIVKGRLRISREGPITIVRINDVYLVEEAELALIKKELHDNLNRPNMRVLLDVKNVRRMSSTAAEMLSDLKQWLLPFGSRLAMCRLRSEMQEMLKAFPGTSAIQVFPDKSVALEAKW